MFKISCNTKFISVLLSTVLLVGGANSASVAEVLRVGSPAANFPNVAPVALAIQLGYFSQLGLQVEMTNYRGGAVAQESLLTGDSDIADIGFVTLAQAVGKGVKHRCVAPEQVGYAGWALLTPSNSKITSVKQLSGARIGITAAGSVSDFLVTWLEKTQGIKPEMIPLGTANTIQGAANSGQVGAYVSWSPSSYTLIKRGVARRLVNYGKEMPPQYTGCWAAMDAVAEKKAESIKKFNSGYLKALTYMKENPEPAIDFLVKFMGDLDRDVVAELYRDVFPGLSTNTTVDTAMVRESLAFGGLPSLPTDRLFNDKFFSLPAGK